MRLLTSLVVLLVACAPSRDEQPVAKRDTGVAPARVTTDPAATTRTDSAAMSGVPAVPSETAGRPASTTAPARGVERIPIPPESLRVKP